MCPICLKYHDDGHPMELLRKIYKKNIKKVNANYSQKQRQEAGKKAWAKNPRNPKFKV